MLQSTADQMEEARHANVMASELGMKPVPYDPDKLPVRCGFELKIDGIGLIDVAGTVQSLEGSPFDCARHLFHELAVIRHAFGTDMVLQGEYIERGGFNATLAAFNSGESKAGGVVLWDAVPLKAWHGYEQSLPLADRRAMLVAAIAAAGPGMVKLNPLVECAPDDAVIQEALRVALDGHHEGLVVKDLASPYVRARSRWWQKLKPCVTVDLPIQSVRIENDRVSSIIVTYDGKPLVVGVMPESLRHQPDEFTLGRIVEIKHVGRNANGTLRGTSFVRFRDDKGARV